MWNAKQPRFKLQSPFFSSPLFANFKPKPTTSDSVRTSPDLPEGAAAGTRPPRLICCPPSGIGIKLGGFITSLVAMEMFGRRRGILTLRCLPFRLFASFQLISKGLKHCSSAAQWSTKEGGKPERCKLVSLPSERLLHLQKERVSRVSLSGTPPPQLWSRPK